MKILIWSLTAVVTLLGTLLVIVLAFAVGWLSDNMGGGADWVKQLSQLPVPAWLSVFLDPAAMEWVRVAGATAMQSVATGLPWVAPMIGWMVPALWVVWIIVLICLIGVACGLHYLVGRKRRLPASDSHSFVKLAR